MPQYGLYDEGSEKNGHLGKREVYRTPDNRFGVGLKEKEKKRSLPGHPTGLQDTGRLNAGRQSLSDSRFADRYRNILSEDERRRQIRTPGSELYQKAKNASVIESCEKKRAEKQKVRALAIAARTGVRMYNPTLQTISRFLTGNDKEDRLLLMQFNSRNGANRARALTRMIRLFLKINPESLSISGEKQIADNAEKLENLSEKFFALQYLITVSPETYNALNSKFRDRFERQYSKAQRIVSYYRLKKQVMTNEYYRTHRNAEIGSKISDRDSPQQKLLSELIWQSEEGLALFLRDTGGRVYEETVKSLARALCFAKAGGDIKKFREKLAGKHELFPKTDPDTDTKEEEHKQREIRSNKKPAPESFSTELARLELTGDFAKDRDSLPKIMDQLNALEEISSFRSNNPDSYYIDQSDARIGICEAALCAKSVLKRMSEDLIFLAHLKDESPEGSLDGADNAEVACKRRYRNELKEYNRVMDSYEEAKERIFDPAKAVNTFNRDFNTIENTPELKKAAGRLLLDLTYADDCFSDRDIYRYMDEISIFSVKLAGTPEGEIFAKLNDRARVLWKEKRYLNLKELKEREPLTTELDQELKLLKSEHNAGAGNKSGQYDIPGGDRTEGQIMALKKKAMEIRPEFNEFKTRTAYYMHQYEWLAGAYPGLYQERAYGTDTDQFRMGKQICGTDRATGYGRQGYDRVRQELKRYPAEFLYMDEDTPVFLQRGDGKIAPPVEITKYFMDRDKLGIAGIYKELKGCIKSAEREHSGLLPHLEKLTEAIGVYSRTQCAVTEESLQLELAALDTFQSEAGEYFRKKGITETEDEVTLLIVSILERLDAFTRGSLRDGMSDEEFEEAMKQTPVYTKRSSTDTVESNVKDLPLFTHRPNVNDIKQGMCGDAHFLAALQTMTASDPGAVLRMFYDAGDGTVLVRLFAAREKAESVNGDEKDLSEEAYDPEPVYVRVRKDYERDEDYAMNCIWVQLLEKAAAAAGLLHGISKTDENGRLENLRYEISATAVEKIITLFTGIKTSATDSAPVRPGKAMSETNVNEMYDEKQMAVLQDIKSSVEAGKAVVCVSDNHAFSVHDVRLYNGRWFLLVRDPGNIGSIEYKRGPEGGIISDRHLLKKGEKLLRNHRVRHSDGTMLSAVLGTSWWELKDFDREMGMYLAYP
ncbi:MAG: hypothetical protein IJR19_04150 [Lachnospiraceae bacterium]|nr:hypothetical protein [Lachnospiraceae bacterium]